MRLLVWASIFVALAAPSLLRASCASPSNAIEAENCLPGTPQSTWDVSSRNAGDPTIQGFADQISVNVGQTINFKINTSAAAYTIDIYRMGYYQGNGARKITSITPSAQLPQAQPSCYTDPSTNLVDCGNWAISASWAVPSTAVSGIYFAHLIRQDTGGDSQIVFVVRNDSSTSNILFQTSDETWQAYNDWGGHSLYGPTGAWDISNRAYKVSYNRPFDTRSFENASFAFYAEYPMVRFLEANAYDVSYITGVDVARYGSLITQHKLYLSVGHDEYWSKDKRNSITAARDAGVNLAFFSGNEGFWKTRWENSIDGTNTPYRTMVTYKETLQEVPIDPQDPPTWTGTWRDPTFSPPADGGQPENAVTGTLFKVNGCGLDNTDLSIMVPWEDGQMRFWRNTPIAAQPTGQTWTLLAGSLGYEWDVDDDNGFRPAGLFHVSTATYSLTTDYLLDYGSLYTSGMATHNMTMYRAATSKALVFGAGTVQWSWGLDSNHDVYCANAGYPSDPNMQQATVNLFADMGVQPGALQGGLQAASPSTDTTPPVSTITSPTSGATVSPGTTVTIQGSASDVGGAVGGVEVSTDGGTTWHPATGRTSWSYIWAVTGSGTATIRTRAVDDSGNLETPSAGVTLNIATAAVCPCSIWPPTATPTVVEVNDATADELGVKFAVDYTGVINGIRFYKGPDNTGPHVGHLWTASGIPLGSVNFNSETASGWQEADFGSPIAVQADTTYVASYSTQSGFYSGDVNYFAAAGVNNPPLHALQNGLSGGNGIYASAGTFPTSSYLSSNYWVDVSYTPTSSVALNSVTVTPANPTMQVGQTLQFTATGNYSDNSTQDITSQVTWSSTKPAAATINSSGLATAVAGGSLSIIATAGVLSGSTGLTVQATPLVITTSSLSLGYQNVPYSTALSATGGVQPYTWSLGAGSALPAGLTLSPTGLITGTPSAVGTSTFTVQVQDSGAKEAGLNQQQTVSSSVNITVIVQPSFLTIWPNTATPTVIDGADPSAVEVGVKFTADVYGSIYGIRFYKSSNNTGTHVGNLWTASGALLASAVFSGESASGWQQVTFSNPVEIAPGTVYVASYHTNTGHYSADQNYFASGGVDNPPLHAPQTGVSGGNGVFADGATSVFPTNTFNASNYWVDVMFVPVPTPTSIAVTPANSTLQIGGTQQFTATATYSDNSTQNITWEVTWGSANTAAATINSAGLATALAGGSSTITATVGAVSGSTTLTVQAGPLSITNTSPLPGGAVNQPYSVALAATGGVAPYAWQLTMGSLPPGLTLSSTGQITGTPTAVGTAVFTVQVQDSGTPGGPVNAKQTVTQQFSITVISAAVLDTIWSPSAVPGTVDVGPDDPFELGVKFKADSDGVIYGLRFYKSAANTGTHVGSLWTISGTLLGSVTFTNETASGWQQVNFANPVPITANTVYVAGYHATVGHYSRDTGYFTAAGFDNPPLHALQDLAAGPDGAFTSDFATGCHPTVQPCFPASSGGGSNYWVDVVFAPTSATLTSITVAPTNSVLSGGTQQFTASGNYSDGTIQDFTNQVAWASSNTNVATISSSGLATPVAGGTSTISATLGSVVGTATLTVPAQPLVVTTTSLPAGGSNQLYSAQLSATGGVLPYSWSLVAGSELPAGFTLSPNGQITGVPTSTMSVTFSVQVTDSGTPGAQVNPQQTATQQLTLVITAPTSFTIFPDTSVPGTVDTGDSNAIEVGVRFQADVSGTVTSIRFYKSAANTGTHIGHLWTNTGTLLASATFSGETVSGWQQVNFSTPVTIAANTVYVASYHTSVGHYSGDTNYFATSGVDNPPLHALQNGVSGADGIFSYDSNSGCNVAVQPCFPVSTFNSANYWVDLVFAPDVVLSVVSVNPATLVGGDSAQASVTLNVPALGQGAVVSLSSDNTDVVAVPATVTVDGGSTTASFSVSTAGVGSQTVVHISGSFNGSNQSALLTVNPQGASVGVATVSLSPVLLQGGSSSTGTVTLSGPAPNGGILVSLASDTTSAATVPESVTVPAGSTSATFTVTTLSVTSTTLVNISATLLASQASAAMTVYPAGVIPPVGWSVAFVDSQETVAENGAAANAIDGNPATYWVTQWHPSSTPLPHEIQINLGAVYTLNAFQYLPRQDGCANGWISQYEFYVSTDGVNWGSSVASGTFNYGGLSTTCPGAGVPAALQVNFVPATGQFVRLRALSEVNGNPWTAAAEINLLGAAASQNYSVAQVTLNPAAVIGGNSTQGTVTLTSPAPFGGLQVTLSSSSPASVPASVMVPAGSTSATFNITTSPVANSTTTTISASYNGGAAQTATLYVNSGTVIPSTGWLATADSQETVAENGAAANAIDGNPATYWVTQWHPSSAPLPHWIQINLGASYTLTAFQYLARQDGCANGWIKQYAFYVSTDGVNWGSPVASGSFNYGHLSTGCPGAGTPSAMQVAFPPTTGQYVRLQALSEVNGNPWTAAAEINVLGH